MAGPKEGCSERRVIKKMMDGLAYVNDVEQANDLRKPSRRWSF